jgi:4-hydroxy-4-methyl-2-oxoglutarate aldolase
MANASVELTRRLQQCYSGAVYDALRDLGLPNQVLPPAIRPLNLQTRLAGPVFSVSGKPNSAPDRHQTLLGWTAMLSKAPEGSVVICQPHDSSLAHFGELSAEAMHIRGVRGYVVDGGCRDTGFIEKLGFPVFCRYFTPRDIVGSWMTESLGDPITIGDVHIRTADFVIADRDGVVIIPAEAAEEVVSAVEQVMATENLVRKAIRQGADPQKAYLQYGKF